MTAAAPPPPAAAPASAPTVVSLRWRKRVVLAFAPTADDPRLLAQRRALETLRGAADDRDLVFVAVSERVEGAADQAEDLRRRHHVEPDAFALVLVGKDGHAALRRDAPVSAAELAGVIDAMPMRRDERGR